MNRRQKLVQQQFLNSEEKVIKRLDQVYKQSLKDITDKVAHLEFTIGKLQEEYDWMDPTDPKAVEVKSKIQSKIYQKKYQEQLKQQVEGIVDKMQVSQFATVSRYLDGCYTDGYIGTFFDLHGQGIPFSVPINQEAMVRAVQLDSKISKGLYTRLGEDVSLLKRKITAQVSRGISTGMSLTDVAIQLKNSSNIGYNNAIRIARTEGHRIQTTATMDACYKAKERGADVVKQWDATLDSKTRESHVAVDHEIRELDKPFSNGLMFPSDPSGSAAEVINCRCALLQRARWALEDGFTKMNNFTKQLETFESPQNYGEFKNGFFSKQNVDYMNYVTKMEVKYGTKDFAKVLGSMTDMEYKRYVNLLNSNPMFNTQAPKATDVLSFTEGQSEAISWYVSGEGQWINQYHRGRGDFGDLSPEEQTLSDLLDEATNRNLPDDVVTLYRSVDATAVFGELDWMDWENLEGGLIYNDPISMKKAQALLDRTKGKRITEKGFMSTSKDYDLVLDWGDFTGAEKPIVIEFENIPKGVKGADLKLFDIDGDEQHEVLLARGTQYEITDIFAKNGQVHVKAKIVTR